MTNKNEFQNPSNSWTQKLISMSHLDPRAIKKSLSAVEWKKVSLAAFLVYTIFALNLLMNG